MHWFSHFRFECVTVFRCRCRYVNVCTYIDTMCVCVPSHIVIYSNTKEQSRVSQKECAFYQDRNLVFSFLPFFASVCLLTVLSLLLLLVIFFSFYFFVWNNFTVFILCACLREFTCDVTISGMPTTTPDACFGHE